jgi:hypothetical protein
MVSVVSVMCNFPDASAQIYQKQASDSRFTQKASTALGAAGGINRFTTHKNVEKALAIKAEKKAKREETKLILGKGVRIAATLWKAQASKDHKLIEVCTFPRQHHYAVQANHMFSR